MSVWTQLITAIKKGNDVFWTKIFSWNSILPNNVALYILFFSAICAVGCLLIRHYIFQAKLLKGIPHVRVFGLPEWLAVFSVSYMVQRLPMVHAKLHIALSTVADILLSSTDYLDTFREMYETKAETNSSIASFLYFLPKNQRLDIPPGDLYDHLFHTMDSVCGLGPFGRVYGSLFSGFLAVIPIVVAAIAIIVCVKNWKSAQTHISETPFILRIIQILVLLYAALSNNGALLAAVLLCVGELGLSMICSEMPDEVSPASEPMEGITQ